MHPLPVPESHEYVMRTAGSVDQSVAPETTASGSQGRLKFQSPHGSRRGQSTHVILNFHTLSSVLIHIYPFIMEDWNLQDPHQEDQENQGQQMDTAPAPPPRIEFGSWEAKPPIEKEKEENNGPSMVSQSYYKPIIGQFPSISSLWGRTERSEHDITRRAPQGARGSSNLNVNKAEKTASIAGPTRQRRGGITGTRRPAKTASSRQVGPDARKPNSLRRSRTAGRAPSPAARPRRVGFTSNTLRRSRTAGLAPSPAVRTSMPRSRELDSPFPDPLVFIGNDVTDRNTVYSTARQREESTAGIARPRRVGFTSNTLRQSRTAGSTAGIAGGSPFPDPVVFIGNDVTDRNAVYSTTRQRAPSGLHYSPRAESTAGIARGSPFPDPVVFIGNDVTDRNAVYSTTRQRAPSGLHHSPREESTAGIAGGSPFPDPVVFIGNDTTDRNTVYSHIGKSNVSNIPPTGSNRHTDRSRPEQHDPSPTRLRQAKVQRNKVSNYFHRKSDDTSDITTPVGCTIAPTNPTGSLGTSEVSGDTHPNRQTASMGAHTQDHSADHGLNMSRHVKLPSELLDVDTQDTSDHTVNTTDNNPLDTADKIFYTDHPPQVPSTLQILESLAGDTPRQLVVPDTVSDADVDGIDTRNRIIRDPGDDPGIGVLTPVGAEAVAGQNPVPNTGTRKRTRDTSRSPDKTHKKVRDDDGTIRETVTDVHDDTRSKFYKIKYVPGRTHSCHSPPLSVPQQADEKKTLLEAMTPAQRTDWHRGRNSQLSSDKAASRYSWLDQALAHEINTHWAFGTIGLLSWLTTDERTINSIFQIRSNAAREVMDVAREHLRRENLKLKAEADDILGDIENTLQPDQAKTSRRLIAQHSDRHMTIFTEDLSERREWLISHQPTMTETMSMRPDSTRQTPGGKLPAELLSEDEPATASRTLNPTTNKKRKNRPKKKSRAAANPLSTAKPPPPRATPPAGTVDNGRPAAPPPKVPASANRTTNRRSTTSSGNVTTRPRGTKIPERRVPQTAIAHASIVSDNGPVVREGIMATATRDLTPTHATTDPHVTRANSEVALRVTAIAETTAVSTRPHVTRDEVTTTPDATPRRLPIFGTGSGRTRTPASPDVRDSPDTTAHSRTGGTNRPH